MASEDANDTACSMLSSCWEREIAALNESYARSVVVVIVFLVVVLIVGVLGNALLLVVYCRKKSKSSSDYLIIVLGFIDLLACLFVHPYMTYKLVYFHLQNWGGVCKLFEFLAHLNLAVSVAVFIAIAVDRFYAVCKPLRFLRSLRLVKILLGVLIPVGVAISLPVLEFVGTRQERVTTLDGERTIWTLRCHYQHRYLDSLALSVFRTLLAGFFAVTVVLISVLYSRVAFAAYQRTRGRVQPSNLGRSRENEASAAETKVSAAMGGSNNDLAEEAATAGPNEVKPSIVKVITVQSAGKELAEGKTDDNICSGDIDKSVDDKKNPAVSSEPEKEAGSEYTNKRSPPSEEGKASDRKDPGKARQSVTLNASSLARAAGLTRRRRTGEQASSSSALRTAKMLFAVTAAFFLSWTPYWVLVVLASVTPEFWAPRAGWELVLERLLMHLFYVNNSVNPVIYAVFNRQFRRDGLQLLKRCLCWAKRG